MRYLIIIIVLRNDNLKGPKGHKPQFPHFECGESEAQTVRQAIVRKHFQYFLNVILLNPNMNMAILGARISECVDDLGLLLDLIYKFSQKQRQGFFDRIQNLKNKLLILKSNIREANTSATEKQYKQLYLSTNSLKNEIQSQTALIPSVKENKEGNRFKDFRDIRKNYEEAMKMIMIKEEEITSLQALLYQKQQLIRMSSDQTMQAKEKYQLTLEINRQTNHIRNNSEIQLQRVRVYLSRAESDLLEMQIREEQKDKAFNCAIYELEQLKIELINANERIFSLQHLAEVKTIAAAENLNQSGRGENMSATLLLKDENSFSKLREVSQLQYELDSKNNMMKEVQQQNKHLREDILVLDNQISKLETDKREEKLQTSLERENTWQAQRQLEQDSQIAHLRQNQLKQLVSEAQRKYLVVITKLNAAEQHQIKARQADFKNQMLIERISALQVYIEKLQNDIRNTSKEKQSILLRKEREEGVLREYEVEIFKMTEKLKMKDETIQTLGQDLQIKKNEIRELEKQLITRQRKERTIQSNLVEQKTRIVQMQQKNKVRGREISGLKIKLMRAKIETIHEIRQAIS